jgi:uncharacterized protein
MEPRMKKYPLTVEQCESVLIRSETGVVATLNDNGAPYAVPVNYIYLNGKIYVHGRAKGQKITNLMLDPRCSFTVFDAQGYNYDGETACDTETDFESVVIQGRACMVDDEKRKFEVLRAISDKYGRNGIELPLERISFTGVIEIIPEAITGKYHKGP